MTALMSNAGQDNDTVQQTNADGYTKLLLCYVFNDDTRVNK